MNQNNMEFERKWLFEPKDNIDYYIRGLRLFDIVNIIQTSEIFNDMEIRYRKIKNVYNSEDKCIITEKSLGTDVRYEKEMEVTELTMDCILKNKTNLIKKQRSSFWYFTDIEIGGRKVKVMLLLEVDEISSLQRTYIEIEFDNKEVMDSFVAPSWFGTEVTHDENHKTRNLVNFL